MDHERIVVAEIVRPRGNRGEVLALSQSDVPGRLQSLKRVRVSLADGSETELSVENGWEHKGDWILKFAGVDSINDADRYRGASIWVPRSERAELPDGEFFRSDLVGCEVVERGSGRKLGQVTGWQQYGGPPMMELRVDGREVLIPFVTALCEVNLAERSIIVDLPEGLLEL